MICTEVFLMKRYRIGQIVKKINVAVQTLRIWDHASKLKPDYVTSFSPSLLLPETT